MSRHMRMSLACVLAIGLVPMMAKPEDPGGGDLKLKATSEDVAELGRIKPEAHIALQQERDAFAAEVFKLDTFLQNNGFTEVRQEAGPIPAVDVAIHHLGLKAGYMSSLEASAKLLVESQEQVATLTSQVADLQLALETAQARAKREAEEAAAPDTELSPALQLQHPVEEIEEVLNAHFRTGGDAVIELHNATGRLKAAVRQVALIEAATSPKAA